jgi:hypothetical protein
MFDEAETSHAAKSTRAPPCTVQIQGLGRDLARREKLAALLVRVGRMDCDGTLFGA